MCRESSFDMFFVEYIELGYYEFKGGCERSMFDDLNELPVSSVYSDFQKIVLKY